MSEIISSITKRFAVLTLVLPRSVKRSIVLILDGALCVTSVYLAFYLRNGSFTSPSGLVIWPVLVSVALALPIFINSGLYRTIFRYNGLPAIVAVARAILLYGLVFAGIFTFWGVDGVPRTLGLIQPILLLLLVGTSRVAAQWWLGSLYNQRLSKTSLPQALIYGAGSAGRQLASALSTSHEILVVGFLDDDDRLHSHLLNGLPIHNPADLAEIMSSRVITDVLLAMPSLSRQRRNEILNELKHYRIALRTLPNLIDIATGKVSMSVVRELDIDDLLGRESVVPNVLLLKKNTHNKTVLVTGAGGSIGSELCRQILKTHPKVLLLVEMNEFALYRIHKELLAMLVGENIKLNEPMRGDCPELPKLSKELDIEIVPLLTSVCNEGRMLKIMEAWKPFTVYHAAAYKHVPLVEHNPVESLINNVWGTRFCAEAAMRNNVRNFVLISTDKAVRPTNIMGASKRLAEMVLQALAEIRVPVIAQGARPPSAKTTFSMVRFGNVLDSSGSVVPLFREQIKNGGPITLTHMEITRFFMTIPEAAQLVMQAGAIAEGGDVFLLDMGQPIKIIDLARRMVELSGLTMRDEYNPDGDIELRVIGLRPGEKLYEELLIGNNPKPTENPRILKAHEGCLSWAQLEPKLNALYDAMSVNDIPVIYTLLKDLVNGYLPNDKVVDLLYTALEREAKASE
jgi:FlaA1/EpsC-like NDP-sugar epimerase